MLQLMPLTFNCLKSCLQFNHDKHHINFFIEDQINTMDYSLIHEFANFRYCFFQERPSGN